MTQQSQISQSNKIFKHTILFSAFVLLAQVFGLLRDLYLAKVFGVGQILDTYYLAFKIPDFLNVFYSVFLGSVIFIPLLTKLKHNGGEGQMQKKINSVGSLVLFSLVFVFIVLEIFMPQFTRLLAPTWSDADLALLTQLSRILLVAQFFFPIGILGGAIGMVYSKPFGMAVSGFIYNFGILLGALLLVPFFGIYGLAYSVIFGAILFMSVQVTNNNSFFFISNFNAKLIYFFNQFFENFRVFVVANYQRQILSRCSLEINIEVVNFHNFNHSPAN
jgi:putative peptidoglycan lipid II flippase